MAELTSGLLIALGLFGPIGPALMLSVMIVAAISVHWANGVFATSNGIEVPLLYATGAATLALTGPGRYSLDAWLGLAPLWTLFTWPRRPGRRRRAVAPGQQGSARRRRVRPR